MSVRILVGDVRERLAELPDESVNCVVTSPPYFGLRDYDAAGQIGIEETLDAYLDALVGVFREVRRVLRRDGTLWLNMGDSYVGSWGAQPRRVTESEEPSWHSSPIKNHPKRARHTGAIRTAGVKPKDLYGVPWRLAFRLQEDGWWLRRDIIWSKPNAMPESASDRPTSAHEYLFLLTRSARYRYDSDAVREGRSSDEDAASFRGGSYVGGEPSRRKVTGNKRIKIPGAWDTAPGGHGTINRQGRTSAEYREIGKQAASAAAMDKGRAHRVDGFNGRWDAAEESGVVKPGRNLRSVWTIATAPFHEAHFATFPPALVEPCIKAGCPTFGTVLDPFGGSGTVGLVAKRLQRDAILIELNPAYAEMARRRIVKDAGLFAQVEICAPPNQALISAGLQRT